MDNVSSVKEKVNIIDLISGYVPLKKAGKNFRGLCPFHKEKTPSFMVSDELQRFRCFGCGKSGDIFNFIMELEGLDFAEALKFLADKYGVKLEYKEVTSGRIAREKKKIIKMNTLSAKFFSHFLLKHEYGKKARDYLKEREIKGETIAKFQLGYAPMSWDSLSKFLNKKGYSFEDIVKAGLGKKRIKGSSYDMFRGRLMFPLVDHLERVLGFSGRGLDKDVVPKYINTAETSVFRKEQFLFGLNLAKNEIKEEGYAVIVEGAFDMISPYQAGIKNIVASQGTALTLGQVKLLKRYTDTAILFFDNDEAGVEASIRSIKVIQDSELDLKIAVLPKKYKDPDEAVRDAPIVLKDAISEAMPIWDYYFMYTGNKFNLNDVYQKKEASQFLLGTIKSIENEILKADYVKKFCFMFDVDEGSVRAQLEKVSGDSVVGSITDQRVLDKHAGNKSGFEDYLSAEVYLLALFFHGLSIADSNKLLMYCDLIKEEYFSSSEARGLFKEFVKCVKVQKPFNAKGLYDKLRDDSKKIGKLLEKVFFYDLEDDLSDPSKLDSELIFAAARLKRDFLNGQLKILSKKIRDAESISDRKLVKKLHKKVKDYTDELVSVSF